MVKLLIINRTQFGYHIDTFYYCTYLKNYYSITYLCFDEGKKKIATEGIDVRYISRSGNLIIRYFRFLAACRKAIRRSFNLVFIKYFQGCSLFRLVDMSKHMIVDVRSASIKPNKFVRWSYDLIMRFEIKKFKNITVISDSLSKRLGISKKKPFILPLGANVLSSTEKRYDYINLIYVGTLFNRKIEETIYGLKMFLKKVNTINVKYTIIGTGLRDEVDMLKNIVVKEDLQHIVEFKGYIKQGDLGYYFDSHNLGVSFVPMTDYYDCQPPTKTFEYILAGIPVLATRTSENKLVVNENNGILIEDNRYAFCDGLICFSENRFSFSSDKVRNSLSNYTWENIIKHRLKGYFDTICFDHIDSEQHRLV